MRVLALVDAANRAADVHPANQTMMLVPRGSPEDGSKG